MRALLILIAFMALDVDARADIRYRIRPRNGELDSFGHDEVRYGECPNEVRYKLRRTLALQPVLTVDSKTQTLRVNFFFDDKAADRNELAAASQFKSKDGVIVGEWQSANPGFSYGASLEERRDKPPKVRLWVNVETTKPDGKALCSETWTGMGEKF